MPKCECGLEMDQDCNGRLRCEDCDGPCLCCFDGGMDNYDDYPDGCYDEEQF